MLANTSVSTPERPPRLSRPSPSNRPAPAATCADTGTQKRAVDRCGCGAHADYRLGRYALCEDCSWSLANREARPRAGAPRRQYQALAVVKPRGWRTSGWSQQPRRAVNPFCQGARRNGANFGADRPGTTEQRPRSLDTLDKSSAPPPRGGALTAHGGDRYATL